MIDKINLNEYFKKADHEYSVLPFWFWNDELSYEEITRQLDDFCAHGVFGFVIHPRVGLPRHLGWMSENILKFYDHAIAEAEKRDMKVVLYDEGMYPSGSSCGQVVAANPEFQTRCLAHKIFEINEPIIVPPEANLINQKTFADGRTMIVIEKKTDSFIRGLHFIEEGKEDEDEPASADILNPESVKKFIELVYEKFAVRYKKYIGKTIVGIFTDEPSMTGRQREKKIFPGTRNIISKINEILGYDFKPHVFSLWDTCPDFSAQKREEYLEACEKLLMKTYYEQISNFCTKHNIPLMGHPHKSDDIGVLRFFQIPGQDMVWREVLPDTPSALEGGNSTQGKCSSSAMLHTGRTRNMNELGGAYGHQFTWDEMNWIAKWCLIRGVNMLIPHAFYFTVRGLRKNERPPDVGPNSPWWHDYKKYADACRIISFLNTNSQLHCKIGILGKCNYLPWQSAKICFENQIDFNYIEDVHLIDDAIISENSIKLGSMKYDFIIYEHELNANIQKALQPLVNNHRVFYFEESKKDLLLPILNKFAPPPFQLSKSANNLRSRLITKDHLNFQMLFNETSQPIKTNIKLPTANQIQLYKPFENETFAFINNSEINLAAYEFIILIYPAT